MRKKYIAVFLLLGFSMLSCIGTSVEAGRVKRQTRGYSSRCIRIRNYNIRPYRKYDPRIRESLEKRLNEYEDVGHLPIITGGEYRSIPTAVCTDDSMKYERHHIISERFLRYMDLDTRVAPAVLIPHDIHTKTGSYGAKSDIYFVQEQLIYEFHLAESGSQLEALTAVFDFGWRDLSGACIEVMGVGITQASPESNARAAISEIRPKSPKKIMIPFPEIL